MENPPPTIKYSQRPSLALDPQGYFTSAPRVFEAPGAMLQRTAPLPAVPGFPVEDLNHIFALTSVGTAPPAPVGADLPTTFQVTAPSLDDAYARNSLFNRFYEQFRPVIESKGDTPLLHAQASPEGHEGKAAHGGALSSSYALQLLRIFNIELSDVNAVFPFVCTDTELEEVILRRQNNLFDNMERRLHELQAKRQLAEKDQLERRVDFERRELYDRQALQRNEQRSIHELQTQILDLLITKLRAKAVGNIAYLASESYGALPTSPRPLHSPSALSHGLNLKPTL